MNLALVVFLVIASLAAITLAVNADAQIFANKAYILQGSGFAVTVNSIKTSDVDFALISGQKAGSSTNIVVEDGFVTLNQDDFITTDLKGMVLRDGRYIRLSGTAENDAGDEISLRIFGRLVQDTKEGSIYGFTGILDTGAESHKIIYTTKLSSLIVTPTQSQQTQEQGETTIRILSGASTQAISSTYVGASKTLRAGYFSHDRITIEPGTSVTFVNDDTVSHRIVSGIGLGSFSRASQGALVICEEPQEELPKGFSFAQTGCTFTFDGRIDTGEIKPGESKTVTFEEAGFYRMIDPKYPWMNIVAYSFPETGSQIIRQSGSQN
jgi:plastocyanin